MNNKIIYGDNWEVFKTLPKNFARLIYIDPPFNTGIVQKRDRNTISYNDSFDDFEAFLMPKIEKCLDHITNDGSLFVHLDYREVHYIKVAIDKLLGRDHFMNEIIWSFDYGGRPKDRWPKKHNTILWYVMDSENYIFNFDAIDRIPYMAPALCGAEKAERGKTCTDVWWNTIVPTNGKEKTGYPTQKPLGILERIIKVHSREGDTVLDFFGGSGTTAEAAAKNNRNFISIDSNIDAVQIQASRLNKYNPEYINFVPAPIEVKYKNNEVIDLDE